LCGLNKPKSAVKPIPEGMHTVTTHLVCGGAAAAIDFYKKAFNSTEHGRMPNNEGKLMHAQIQVGDSVVMLHDEYPDMGLLGPKARNGTSVTLHLYVEDADCRRFVCSRCQGWRHRQDAACGHVLG
jgi:uncharacterized glyoxalase superfamily protein PhnB